MCIHRKGGEGAVCIHGSGEGPWASMEGEGQEGPCAGRYPWNGEGEVPCAYPHRRWHREGRQAGGRAQHCQKQGRQACGSRGRSGSMEVLAKWPPGPEGAKREKRDFLG